MRTSQDHDLPRRRIGHYIALLERASVWQILMTGVGIYSIIPILLAIAETVSASYSYALVMKANVGSVTTFGELLYFNFITILTVGYGDLSPVSIGCLLSVLEAGVGVGLLGIVVAVVTIKALLPPTNAIVFSKYGYYCTENQAFLVIFVNTSRSFLVNPEMCSYYRQGEDWDVRPAYRAPFIGHSIWTFFVEEVSLEKLVAGTEKDNALRFGITGQLGLATVSAFVEYEPDDILVIPNRNEIVAFDGFRDANLGNEDVRRMFHYFPLGSMTLKEFVKEQKEGRAA